MINIAAAIALVGIIAVEAYERVHLKKEEPNWLVAVAVLSLTIRIFI